MTEREFPKTLYVEPDEGGIAPGWYEAHVAASTFAVADKKRVVGVYQLIGTATIESKMVVTIRPNPVVN